MSEIGDLLIKGGDIIWGNVGPLEGNFRPHSFVAEITNDSRIDSLGVGYSREIPLGTAYEGAIFALIMAPVYYMAVKKGIFQKVADGIKNK